MNRACFAASGLAMLMAFPAYAADVPRPTPTPDHVDVEEAHRFPVLTQGAIGAAGGVLVTAGVALLADSYVRYDVLRGGSDGTSCRPCTAGQVATPRAEYGLGIAFLATGGILAITAGVLAGLDHSYRREHEGMRTSRLRLTPQGLRF